MEYTLKDQDAVKLYILGISYIVKADGSISNGESTVYLEDVFANLPKDNILPDVDYSKISTEKFVYDRVSRAYLSNNNVFSLQDFIELNEKILLETNQEKDIFDDMIILTVDREFHAMSEIPIGRGIASYSFLYCIANIHRFTGEMPINISAVRSENSTFDISEISLNLLKYYALSEDDINKRYCKHYESET